LCIFGGVSSGRHNVLTATYDFAFPCLLLGSQWWIVAFGMVQRWFIFMLLDTLRRRCRPLSMSRWIDEYVRWTTEVPLWTSCFDSAIMRTVFNEYKIGT